MARNTQPEVAEVVEVTTTPETPKVIVAEDKFVEVTPKVTLGQRYVGGVWLDIQKDKTIKVTQDQKRVLREADAIFI